jgi:protein dithiol oxidoreductase (disulfide-forming)
MIRKAFTLLCSFVLLLTTIGVAAQDQPYAPVNPQQPTQVPAGKIEVLEFFWYGCPHCYSMEPFVEKWLQTKPADVEFIRVPGVLNKVWMEHARAYYTAQKLGVLEQVHRPLFDALHKERRKIFTQDELRDFFADKGVKTGDFDRVYNSHDTEIRVKQAYVMAQNYRLTGVPAFIVNGKYATSGQLAGTYENIITTINKLVEMERGAAAPAPSPQ